MATILSQTDGEALLDAWSQTTVVPRWTCWHRGKDANTNGLRDHFTIILVFRGVLKMGTVETDAVVPAGSALVLPPQPMYRMRSEGIPDFLAFLAGFAPVAGPSPWGRLALPIVVPLPDSDSLRDACAATCDLSDPSLDRLGVLQRRLAMRPLFDRLLTAYLSSLVAMRRGGPLAREPSPARAAAMSMRRDLRAPAMANHLAQTVGVPPRTLRRQFRSAYGMAPTVYHRHVRLDHAAYLLETDPALNLHDIAQRCGYRTMAGFVHAFARHHGQPPKRWLRQRRSHLARGAGTSGEPAPPGA
ncbi:hypothetical protein LBMAG53_17480 [Planctomycetota bacterium]|nr:hypothetical protein LBMAG53_17480 [Planctomycetota bacterium]